MGIDIETIFILIIGFCLGTIPSIFIVSTFSAQWKRIEKLESLLDSAHDALGEIIEDNPGCTTAQGWAHLPNEIAQEVTCH